MYVEGSKGLVMDIISELQKNIKKSDTKIVFPEGQDDRVVIAAVSVVQQGIATPIILGNENIIRKTAAKAGLTLEGINIIDILASPKLGSYAEEYCKGRDFPVGAARNILSKPSYFGAMMVKTGEADTMISGVVTETEEVVLASELIIGLQSDIATPSTFCLMDIPGYQGEEGSLLIFSDVVLNVSPNPEQLADIAIASARSARAILNWEPRVAMLSFSTMGSATHPAVDKVIEATRIVKERELELYIDGELQVDAAIVPEVAKRKIKGTSSVAGKANILIFPDLEAGNIGEKLVQRLAKAECYGSFLQGFNKRVSDMSRGATVKDITGTAVILAAEVQNA